MKNLLLFLSILFVVSSCGKEPNPSTLPEYHQSIIGDWSPVITWVDSPCYKFETSEIEERFNCESPTIVNTYTINSSKITLTNPIGDVYEIPYFYFGGNDSLDFNGSVYYRN